VGEKKKKPALEETVKRGHWESSPGATANEWNQKKKRVAETSEGGGGKGDPKHHFARTSPPIKTGKKEPAKTRKRTS